ncbi:MAG: hypothetical protein KAW12_02520, partial [Candidatus Aminicenantes bacterium]|nr:hypothetical protein [Candidatus Aminicenantes bacterium]
LLIEKRFHHPAAKQLLGSPCLGALFSLSPFFPALPVARNIVTFARTDPFPERRSYRACAGTNNDLIYLISRITYESHIKLAHTVIAAAIIIIGNTAAVNPAHHLTTFTPGRVTMVIVARIKPKTPANQKSAHQYN